MMGIIVFIVKIYQQCCVSTIFHSTIWGGRTLPPPRCTLAPVPKVPHLCGIMPLNKLCKAGIWMTPLLPLFHPPEPVTRVWLSSLFISPWWVLSIRSARPLNLSHGVTPSPHWTSSGSSLQPTFHMSVWMTFLNPQFNDIPLLKSC